MRETHDAPAPFIAIGFPDQDARETHYALGIPWAMGLIGTRSLTQEIPGFNDLVAESEDRIRSGLIACDALMDIHEQRDQTPQSVRATLEKHGGNLGCACPLKRYVDDPRDATEDQIIQASNDMVPGVAPLFWSFRIMVGLGFSFIALMACFFRRSSFHRQSCPRRALRLAVVIIPAPWIGAEPGWFVAGYGRQSRTVDGVVPTVLSVSHLSVADILLTMTGFMILYELLVYDVLRVIWWLLLDVLLIGFALTDGFDMGVAALLSFVGQTDVEPLWSTPPGSACCCGAR